MNGTAAYTRHPVLREGPDGQPVLAWEDAPATSGNDQIVGTVATPFAANGGLRLLQGNLGRSVIKVSAVKPEHQIVQAPAIVFDDQEELLAAYKRGELQRDFVAVVRGQGPRANGMPELHSLTPTLTNLQDQGFKVALVTDGRMSGASGKVPAAIHITPEVVAQGPLGRVRTGDVILLDAVAGTLDALVPAEEWNARELVALDREAHHHGMGRNLFGGMRHTVTGAEQGAASFGGDW